MITEEIIQKVREYALAETEKYGTPPRVMLELAENKCVSLAKKLGADENMVRLMTYLMDIKLGEALKAGIIKGHVSMSSAASKELLAEFSEITDGELAKVINGIEAHHGAVPYSCIESEIAANGDAYKFLHPTGIFEYFVLLGERKTDFTEVLDQVEAKMDEKYAILSLADAKEELEPYYQTFKKYLKDARGL